MDSTCAAAVLEEDPLLEQGLRVIVGINYYLVSSSRVLWVLFCPEQASLASGVCNCTSVSVSKDNHVGLRSWSDRWQHLRCTLSTTHGGNRYITIIRHSFQVFSRGYADR